MTTTCKDFGLKFRPRLKMVHSGVHSSVAYTDLLELGLFTATSIGLIPFRVVDTYSAPLPFKSPKQLLIHDSRNLQDMALQAQNDQTPETSWFTTIV